MKRLLSILLLILLPALCSAQCVEDNLPEPVQISRLGLWAVGGGGGEEPGGCTGNGSVGAAEADADYFTLTANTLYYSEYTASSAGCINYVHVDVSSTYEDEQDIDCGIWTTAGVLLHSVTSSFSSSGTWLNITIGEDYNLAAGTYLIGCTFDGVDTEYVRQYVGGETPTTQQISMDQGSIGNFTPGNSTEKTTRKMLIIFNNSSGDPL